MFDLSRRMVEPARKGWKAVIDSWLLAMGRKKGKQRKGAPETFFEALLVSVLRLTCHKFQHLLADITFTHMPNYRVFAFDNSET